MDIRTTIRLAENHIDLLIKLTPNSSVDKIIGIIDTDGDQKRLAIKVRAVPEKGRANKAAISFLAKILSLPKSSLEIAAGSTNRNKTIRISGDPQMIMKTLGQLDF